jgi:PAS domain S-box-containing protein
MRFRDARLLSQEMNAANGTSLLAALEALAPHDHLCSIYESPEEHFAVAVPFIRIGLDRGEKCIYVADDGTEDQVRDAMQAEGIDVDLAIATNTLVLCGREGLYLKNGSFDPDWMHSFWTHTTAEALTQGFAALRATGETGWLLGGVPGIDRWLEYESRMNHILARHNCTALCQYNRRLFPPELILDVIRTHPTVIYRGVVCRNMYYVPPEELLEPNNAAKEVDRLLGNIRDREEIEDALRQQRNELAESEQRWRSVFENSAIGMVMGDSSANILASNQAFQELVGYTGDELRQFTVFDLTHESDVPLNMELRAELIAGARREMQMEKRLRAKDGRLVWVRVTSSKIRGFDGTSDRVVALVEDITARRLAEQERDASLNQSRTLAAKLMHAQDDERRRIAQMLHETTAQDLAALKMQLARLNRSASRLSDSERTTLTESMSLAEQSMTEIRTLSYLLHPPFLDEAGLVSALRWYAPGFAKRSGIDVELELPEQFERLPLDTETALFRIVQESLINIHRHAESPTARIRLRRNAGTLVLEIEDRGRGIPKLNLGHITNGGAGVGVGIAGISERIEQLGGLLEITSSECGTTLRVQLPLAQEGQG